MDLAQSLKPSLLLHRTRPLYRLWLIVKVVVNMLAGYIFLMRRVVTGGHRIPHLHYVLIVYVLFLIKDDLPVDDLDLLIASLQELLLVLSAHGSLLVLPEHELSLLLLLGQLAFQ